MQKFICNKIFITTAEINELSSAAYRNIIIHYEWKILAKIQLRIICAHVEKFWRLGHKCFSYTVTICMLGSMLSIAMFELFIELILSPLIEARVHVQNYNRGLC